MMNDENITIENDLINNNEKYIIEIEECIFCQESSSDLIDYEHSCGRYKIHQECLNNWFELNKTSCIICRKDILTPENSPNKYNISDSQQYLIQLREFRELRELNSIQNEEPHINNCSSACFCIGCIVFTSIIIFLTTNIIK
jgi:hypothetical protein